MDTGELNNLGQEESFQDLKDRCKSRAKAASNPLLIIVIILMLVIATVIFGLGPKGTNDISFMAFWLVFCCLGGLTIVSNYRLTNKIDHMVTPNQLLESFKKHLRVELISASVLWMFLIADSFIRGYPYQLIGTLAAFIVVMFLVIKGFGPWNRRDREIIEDLKQLVENK